MLIFCLILIFILFGAVFGQNNIYQQRFDNTVLAITQLTTKDTNINSTVNIQLPFHPAAFGQNVVVQPGQTHLFVEVVASSPDIYGCLNNSQSWSQYQGRALLMMYGQCPLGQKALSASLSGSVLDITMNCDFASCGPDERFTMNSDYPIPIPAVVITYADGQTLLNLLSTYRVFISIPGTSGISASDLSALRQIAAASASTLMSGVAVSAASFTRDWTDLLTTSNAYTVDPCLNRIFGTWCTHDRITVLELTDPTGLSSLPPSALSLLTALSYVDLTSNFINGPLDCAFTLMTNLSSLSMPTANVTNVPHCFATMKQLRYLDLSNNNIVNMPDLGALTDLVFVDVHGNGASGLFPIFDLFANLVYVDLSSNHLTGSFGLLTSSLNLTFFSIAGNKATTVQANAFDGLNQLTTLDLSSNNIVGLFPNLQVCSALTTLSLSSNNFTAPFPAFWSTLSSLSTLDVSHTLLSSPIASTSISVIAHLPALTNFYCSFTGLSNVGAGGFYSTEPGLWLTYDVLPPTIVVADLSSNLISGDFGTGNLGQQMNTLQVLLLAGNQFTHFPPDAFIWPVLQTLDFSNNNLTGSLPLQSPPASLKSLLVYGNPFFVDPKLSIPSWVSSTGVYSKTDLTSKFSCPQLQGPRRGVQLQVDAEYYGYQLCVCDRGTYGAPPGCSLIPYEVNIPYSQSSSRSISTQNHTISRTSSSASNNVTFSDSQYGNQRLLVGMDTVWFMSIGNDTNTHDQTVRVINVKIDFNPQYFNTLYDILDIYEGGTSLLGTRVSSFRGDIVLLSGVSSYIVPVLSSSASLNFKSRDTEGTHFVASYTPLFVCPLNYIVGPSGNCVPVFALDSSISILIYVVSGVVSAFVLCVFFAVLFHSQTVLIRASSFRFCVFILCALLTMSATASLYAVSPQNGDVVCNMRVWMTAISVSASMAALLMKAYRIQLIFSPKELKKIQGLSDLTLLLYISLILSLQLLLLVFLSSFSLTSSQLIVSSALPGGVEWGCRSTESIAYTMWLAVQLAYTTVFLVCGAKIAWGIKDTPCAFNESTHIVQTLVALIFFLVILVPVNFIVNDSPNALMLIRGLGQSVCAITMCLAIFAPKLYYLFLGEGDNPDIVSSKFVGHGATRLSKRGSDPKVRIPSPSPAPSPRGSTPHGHSSRSVSGSGSGSGSGSSHSPAAAASAAASAASARRSLKLTGSLIVEKTEEETVQMVEQFDPNENRRSNTGSGSEAGVRQVRLHLDSFDGDLTNTNQ